MRASDLVSPRPGGLIVTESLAAGLPMIFVDMIPGQETGNADYVVVRRRGRGRHEPARNAADRLSLARRRRPPPCREGRERQGPRPARAAFDIADRAWALAERGPEKREPPAAAALAMLKELFESFGERFEE